MDFNRLINTIKTVFSKFDIDGIAKSSKFCVRKRNILPLPFVASLITALGDRSISAITDIHRISVSKCFMDKNAYLLNLMMCLLTDLTH